MSSRQTFVRSTLVSLALAAALGTLAAPHPAQAWWRGGPYGPGYGYGGGWRGGVTFGFVPPPIYVEPPQAYYATPSFAAPYYAQPAYPPAIYPPPIYAPGYAAPQAAQGCYAGPYACPLDVPTPLGGPCSCPANNGRIYGRAG